MNVTIYRNKRNPHKYIEVHNDGYYHNAVRQYMLFSNGVKNMVGDGFLHRWRKKNLDSLLEDYINNDLKPEENIDELSGQLVIMFHVKHYS